MSGVSRRDVLLGVGGVIAGGAGVAGAGVLAGALPGGGSYRGEDLAAWAGEPTGSGDPARAPSSSDNTAAYGTTQAGVDRPAVPQPFGLLAVLGLPTRIGVRAVATRLARTGAAIAELTDDASPLPGGPGDLTVTVGLGPRIVAAVDPDLPGATDLPRFAGDDAIDDTHRGGDVLLAVHGSDPTVLPAALRRLRHVLGAATLRWSEPCFRGPGSGTVTRNPLGFHDGIAVPHGPDELAREVWLPGPDDGGDARVAGGTICVLRRLVLDTERFAELGTRRQEAVIGRRRSDGAPLSGGGPWDDVDLRAKTPEGEYLVPADAHARAAHPSFTGSGLMLRRGYGFQEPSSNGENGAAGLFFVCFQRELDTFVRTQERLDETDALRDFTTPTASATFLILPGFDADRPLGSALMSGSGPAAGERT